ncbi:MAG: YfhO family protein, partial [Opitutaceae bacterium]|nr:YfhO family protein [Opitutaceae bacterium]
LGLLLDKNFDPRGTALLYAPSAEIPENILNQQAGFAPVTFIRQTNNTITIKADAGCDAVLVVADTYYKWWRATVDGRPAKIYKVNMAQKAVLFPAGEHTVRFVCVPGSFYIGCGLFIPGAAAGAWLLLRGRRRRRVAV